MIFYILFTPDYNTDHEFFRHNPFQLVSLPFIPPRKCEECGTWGSTARIRKDFVFSNKAKNILKKSIITVDEWIDDKRCLSEELNVPYESIKPGIKLGLPKVIIKKNIHHDFYQPFPGIIFVPEEVKKSLIEFGATGFEFIKVIVNNKSIIDMNLWEINVLGKANSNRRKSPEVKCCSKCGRKRYPHLDYLEIDESTWDGSDFFYVDDNPNMVIVTEKIKKLIDDNNFDNVRLIRY